LTPAEVLRLRSARPAGPPPQPATGPVRVQRRASNSGVVMVVGQKVALGRVSCSQDRHHRRLRYRVGHSLRRRDTHRAAHHRPADTQHQSRPPSQDHPVTGRGTCGCATMAPCRTLERIMARRSPAQVRRDAPHPLLNRPMPTISGLSPRGAAAIARFERRRLWPGAAREALDAWTLFLRDTYHRLFDPKYGCDVPMCCPDPNELRATLEAIAHVLPRKDARLLRVRLAKLDARW
jgi:hypothetical protein